MKSNNCQSQKESILIKSYTLTLPFPPSSNTLFPTFKGRRIKSKKYNQWLQHASEYLDKQEYREIKNRCNITYLFEHPDNRGRDVCNYEKALTDFLVAVKILKDDSKEYIKSIKNEWYDVKGNNVYILIEEILS